MSPLLTGLPFVQGGGTPKATVTGSTGSPTIDTTSRAGKTIYKFTGSGTITIGVAGSCEILCIGGGGSGAYSGPFAGTTSVGGSAGGMVTTTTAFLPAGTQTITVGAGGAAYAGNTKLGNAGNGSLIGSTYYAQGGGGAVHIEGMNTEVTNTVVQCGTGGFGTTSSMSGRFWTGGGLGNSGGSGFYVGSGNTNNRGGGSGGAGGAGGNASSGTIGAAGAGLADSITGTSVTYAAGSNGSSGAGTANTGNGGGSGVAGGSGFVVIVIG